MERHDVTPDVITDVQALLSAPRLAPHRRATGGDPADALTLCTLDVQLSATFYESLHYFEVGVRNRLDQQLSAWATTLEVDLPEPTGSRDGREELPGRVVAELTFGFWWSLLAEEYNRTLWQPCLRQAFTQVRRQRLHATVDEMRQLRNRIAHHEPIHGRDPHRDYAQLLDTAGRTTPRLRWLIATSSRVPDLLPPA